MKHRLNKVVIALAKVNQVMPKHQIQVMWPVLEFITYMVDNNRKLEQDIENIENFSYNFTVSTGKSKTKTLKSSQI